MTNDDVVMLFEGDDRVTVFRTAVRVVRLRCTRPGERPAVDVEVAVMADDTVSVVTLMDGTITRDPHGLAARLLVAAEVVETLRTSGVVDGQRVGGA